MRWANDQPLMKSQSSPASDSLSPKRNARLVVLERQEALLPAEAAQYVSLMTREPFTEAHLWELVLNYSLVVSVRCKKGAVGLRGKIVPEAEASAEPSLPVFPMDLPFDRPNPWFPGRENDRYEIARNRLELLYHDTYVRSLDDRTVLQLDPVTLEPLDGVFDLCFAGDIENIVLNNDAVGGLHPGKKSQKLAECWGLFVKQDDTDIAWQLMEATPDRKMYAPAVGLPFSFELVFRRSHLLRHIEDAMQEEAPGDVKISKETALVILGAILNSLSSMEKTEKALKIELASLEIRGFSKRSLAEYFAQARRAFTANQPISKK